MKASINQIHHLVEVCLGRNYISKNRLRRILMRRFFLATVFNGHQLVGVAWMRQISGRHFTRKTKGGIKLSKDVLILDVMAVHPNFQMKGIGKCLMENLMNQIGKRSWFCFAWKSSNGVHMDSLLKKVNAKRIWGNEAHYFHESLSQNYICPECGNPCKCGVTLYLKCQNW